jgi:amino acid permease
MSDKKSDFPVYEADAMYGDQMEKNTSNRVVESHLVEADKFGETKRALKSRHVQLIALGGGQCCSSLSAC